jgi:C4-dicarboxylate transporter DctM subunit
MFLNSSGLVPFHRRATRVAGASCFGRLLTLKNIPPKITEAVILTIQSPWVFLLVMNGFLLIVGWFMEFISATLILTFRGGT